MRSGIARLGLRAEWRHELTGGGTQWLDYAGMDRSPAYSIGTTDWARELFQATLTGGMDFNSGWRITGDVGGQLSSGERLWSIGAGATKSF
jgi:hypothetical protein